MNTPTSKNFFVTCLPRSRSAWFANLFTHCSHCFHDVFDGLETFDEFVELMSSPKWEYRPIGASDPALVYFWERTHAAFPDAKWVVIERDVDSVYKSLEKLGYGIGMDVTLDAKRRLIELRAKLNPLVVNFDEINSATVNRIATYLDIDVGDSNRINQLCRMNVQVEHNYLRERIAHNVSNPSQLLKEMASHPQSHMGSMGANPIIPKEVGWGYSTYQVQVYQRDGRNWYIDPETGEERQVRPSFDKLEILNK